MLNQKKVSGILCESFSNTFEKDNKKYWTVLIGVGLNVNAKSEELFQVS